MPMQMTRGQAVCHLPAFRPFPVPMLPKSSEMRSRFRHGSETMRRTTHRMSRTRLVRLRPPASRAHRGRAQRISAIFGAKPPASPSPALLDGERVGRLPPGAALRPATSSAPDGAGVRSQARRTHRTVHWTVRQANRNASKRKGPPRGDSVFKARRRGRMTRGAGCLPPPAGPWRQAARPFAAEKRRRGRRRGFGAKNCGNALRSASMRPRCRRPEAGEARSQIEFTGKRTIYHRTLLRGRQR